MDGGLLLSFSVDQRAKRIIHSLRAELWTVPSERWRGDLESHNQALVRMVKKCDC